MEAHSRPKSTEPVPCSGNVQDGNSGDHQTFPATGGVGHFAGFQRRLFSHPHKPQVAKISQVPLKRSDLSVHSTSLWPVDGSVGVHKGGQRGKTHGPIEGYSNPPIPRRLVTESPMPGNLPTSYADPFGPLPLSRLGRQHGQIRAGSPTNLRLRRLSFRPISGVSQTNSGQVEESISEAQPSPGTGMLLSQAVHVFDRPSDGDRKTSSLGAAAYETHSMAPKKHWHAPESLEKVIPIPPSLHVHLRWWLDPAKVLSGQPLHPLQHALQLFTDASNEGWGAHLGDYMAKGVWLESEGALHINLLELKAVLLALKRFERLCCNQIVLVCTDNTTVVSYINKEGGMKSGSLCALLWRPMLWCNQRQIVLRARHIPGHLNVIADKLS